MKYWRDEIIAFCEKIEDEETPFQDSASQYFQRGRRYTAKQIRNFVGDLARELEADNPIFKYGHRDGVNRRA